MSVQIVESEATINLTINGVTNTLNKSELELSVSGNYVNFISDAKTYQIAYTTVSRPNYASAESLRSAVQAMIDNAVLTADVAALQVDVDTIAARTVTINTNVSDVEALVNTINGNVNDVETKVDTLTTNLATANGNINDTETKVDTLTTNLATANTNINTANTTLTTINGNVNDTETKVDTLTTNLATANANIVTINSTANDINTLLNTVNGNVNDTETKVDTLTTNLATANGNINDTETKVDTLTTNLATANGNINDIETKVDTLTTNLATANGNINDTETKVDTLTTNLATANTNISDIETIVNKASYADDTTVSKAITLDAGITTADTKNLFTVTGTCLVKRIYGVITTDTTLTNITGVGLQLYDTNTTTAIDNGALTVNAPGANTVMLKVEGSATNLAHLAGTAQGFDEGGLGSDEYFYPFLVKGSTAVTTYIRFKYTTTTEAANGAMTWYCIYEPISPNGALAAA